MKTEIDKIDDYFIKHVANVLGETQRGLTGPQIIKHCNTYAVRFNVSIPITSDDDFSAFDIPNKRTALYKNLREFSGNQQFAIINELCQLPKFANNTEAQELQQTLCNRYSRFSITPVYLTSFEPTGWTKVDHSLDQLKAQLEGANTEVLYQTIGMMARETLLIIAQEVYDPIKYPTTDRIKSNESKRMLDAFLKAEMKDNCDTAKKWCLTAIDFANQLTHKSNATKEDAALCVVAVNSVASLIKALVYK